MPVFIAEIGVFMSCATPPASSPIDTSCPCFTIISCFSSISFISNLCCVISLNKSKVPIY